MNGVDVANIIKQIEQNTFIDARELEIIAKILLQYELKKD